MNRATKRKERIGVVVSNCSEKTVSVAVQRKFPHPLYKKYVEKTTKLMVHDEANSSRVGDRVKIMETRPISKRKCWRLVEIVTPS